jgi:hypothetical protein
MRRQPSSEPPVTYGTDAEAMRDELDYEDMVALSGMYRRWAIYEAGFTPERRTTLMAWSADLERIAAWVGKGWRAPPSSSSETSLLQFLARLEREASRPIKLEHAKRWLGLA